MKDNNTTTVQSAGPTHPRRGIVFALLAIPLGVIAWVLLWQFGFIASIVAWGIAAGAVWLYRVGSGQDVTKPVAPYIVAVIVIGVILAFLGGMVSDAWAAYTSEAVGGAGISSAVTLCLSYRVT